MAAAIPRKRAPRRGPKATAAADRVASVRAAPARGAARARYPGAMRSAFAITLVLLSAACGDDDGSADAGADAATATDGATPGPDADTADAATADAAGPDAAPSDAGACACAEDEACVEGRCVWRPAPGTRFYWQLQGTIDPDRDVDMYDVDLFDAPDDLLASLQARGVRVVCYFSAGSWEEWRDDAEAFPDAALGNPLDGWPGERWLDVRDATVRAIMSERLDHALARGCDGVEPDNMDGYTNDPGFDYGPTGQADYARFLAAEAHARGLSIGLKNDLDQIGELVTHFDWALNEQCFEYDECDVYGPFLDADKAVFQVDYGPASLAETVCPDARALGLSSAVANLALDGSRWIPCWP